MLSPLNPGIFTLSNKLKGYGVETEKTRDANVYLTNDLEELVKRYLPHGKKSQFVYEIVLEETKYQRNPKELSNFLTHPDFEGVYERHTPLLFRVLVQLGCVARVSNSASLARRRATAGSEERERPYNLDEM